MDRNHVINALKTHEPEPKVNAGGVASLYLFGPTARGEARAGCDIGLFLDRHNSRFSPIKLV